MKELIFSIVMLFQVTNSKVIGTASGFLFESNNETYLITNRHVVEYSIKEKDPKLVFRLHTSRNDLSQLKLIEIPLIINNRITWLGYKDTTIDVVAIHLDKKLISGTIITSFSEKDCPPKGIELPIGMDLLVIGYPRGFSDTINFTPTAKSCMISTPTNIRFENKPFFLIDGKLFPGMSGSPVITKPSTTFVINGETNFYNENKSFFLGVFSSSVSKKIGMRDEPVYEMKDQQIFIKGFKKVPVNEDLELQTCWFNSQVINLIKDSSN